MSTEFDCGWVIGFIEGEGSFTHDWVKREGKKVKVPRFTLNQTERSVLEFLQEFFGGGNIYVRNYTGKDYWSHQKSTRYDYVVRDKDTLQKIRDFCEGKLKHPMKKEQFEEWKKLFANIRGKEAQREKAREEMIKRWEDPSYREKVLNAIKPYWDRKVRSILAKKGWERRRRKLDAKGS
jgi:truncated hemoglobin YjbI